MSNLDTAANTLITSESFKDELTKLATGDDSKTKRWLKNIAIIAAAPAIGFGLGRYAMYPVTRALVSKTGRKFIRSHPKTSKALAYGLPAAAGGAARPRSRQEVARGRGSVALLRHAHREACRDPANHGTR